MPDFQSRIAGLSPDKRDLLERRLADLAARRGQHDLIMPRDRSGPTPLAVAQQREWAIERLRGANNVTCTFRVEGELDLDRLGVAFTEVVERHEVLRSTVVVQDDGTPVQVVRPVTAMTTPVVDLSLLSLEQQRAELRRRCSTEGLRRFDPADALRLRISLIRLDARTHVAVLITDHAASDAWSLAILMQEVVELYDLRRDGGSRKLPPPEIQFGDFAAWQRERMGEEQIEAELQHWRQTLDGASAGLALPTDRPHAPLQTFAGAVHRTHLSPDLAAELRRFGEGENASLFVMLLAASSVLLYRYLDQGDLVIGGFVSGRTRMETERLIGCFANPLPLRMGLGDEQTLRAVVEQARNTIVSAYDHQDVPFARLIDELGLGREASQTSLSRIWINVLTVAETTLEGTELRVTLEPVDLGRASIDLTLSAVPRADTIELQWQYMVELFDADTIALLADQFHAVLRQIVTAPDRTVQDVSLVVTAAPTNESSTTTSSGVEGGFIELFQRSVARAPNAPAVICDGAPTSYADLNLDANRLAHYLRTIGVRRDTPVGILVDRSPQLAVAILGILKAGGAYVALDPTYPADRIAFMLSDAGARILVTRSGLASALLKPGTVPPDQTVILDDPSSPLAAIDTDQDLPAPTPASLAYLAYTSGSTGQPKGAMITHRSLAAYALEVVERLELGASDRFLQFASPSFDVLVEELFPTWTAGGAVVIPTHHLISGGADLVELIEREQLTLMELPTAYWHEWVRELDNQDRELPGCLRLVIIGGERVLAERLAMWHRHQVSLMHVYGLTETTVSSTFFRLDPAGRVGWPNLPIGTALPGTGLSILGSRLRPVPVGAVGELYIGGMSLARGYMGSAGLTALRFVADPNPRQPGGRLYRTGDLVRQRADGNLEFISRVDTQIKLRGFRVEPTEIESAINRHRQVAESVVSAYEPSPGDRRLVAYLVAGQQGTPSVGEMRGHLERQLPSYMVPSAFVQLDRLPLGPNGKLDRARLPAPEGGRLEQAEEYVAPQTPVQLKLAGILAAVVGVDKVGIHDNFFEIGGDSILAIQVVARAHQEGVRLEPYELFVHPTVARLSEVVAGGPSVDAEQSDVTGPVPMAPSQQWFCTVGVDEPHLWNLSVQLDLREPGEPQRLREAVEHIVAHHDGLRQRFLLAGEQTRIRIAPRGDVTPFEVYDLSDLDDAALTRRVSALVEQVQTSLNLAVGPLLRVALFKFSGMRPDRLCVIVHRLAADTSSLHIVLEDLHTALSQVAAGDRIKLPAKTTSWQSWVRRLVAHGTTDQVRTQRRYWSEIATLPIGEVPLDMPSGLESNTAATARTVDTSLTLEETDALLRAVPDVLECRVHEVLLAAYSRTLNSLGQVSRYIIDFASHNRVQILDDVDLTRTVGLFTRTFPIALQCDDQSPPEDVLRSVQETVRSVPSGGIGWQLLRQGPDPVPEAPVALAFSYVEPEGEPAYDRFTVVREPTQPDEGQGPRGRRRYLIEVEASISGDRLDVRWCYSERLHDRQTMQRLAERYLDELRLMIDVGRHAVESRSSASDFPLARVDQDQLDRLLSRVRGHDNDTVR